MVESFWAVPDVADMRTPLGILREQAAALTKATNGVLVGAVETERRGDHLILKLEIVAPALNDYRYRILNYQQPIGLYPGKFYGYGTDPTEVSDEANFVSAIKHILASEAIKKVLKSLLAQTRDP